MDTQLNPLLLIKPKGITSYTAINKLKKVLPRKTKIGHCGTLDPMAEGLLLVLVGREQTKLQDSFLNLKKKYIAQVTFGVSSNTYDVDGNSEFAFSNNLTCLKDLDIKQIETVLALKFKGEILQTVPAFSAVQIEGRRLYSMARNNEHINLPVRKVTIYDYKILNFTNNTKELTKDINKLPKLEVEFEVSKGTYIRSVANDLGAELKVKAVLSGLNRIQVSNYKIEDALTVDQAKEFLTKGFI